MIGIDEAGRGSLVGGVFVCALYSAHNLESYKVKDSKLLSAKKRIELYNSLTTDNKIKFAVSTASLEEIENLNVLNATMLAMQRAFDKLQINEDVKIDGNKKPPGMPFAECIVKGDKLIPHISAASIIAKVERDFAMQELHLKIPQYNISQNKGYGTKKHLEAIKKFGLSSYHRKGWKI